VFHIYSDEHEVRGEFASGHRPDDLSDLLYRVRVPELHNGAERRGEARDCQLRQPDLLAQ